MASNHTITLPPELVNQWCYEDGDEVATSPRWYRIVCTKAAQWGADQELEACVEWFKNQGYHPEVYRDLLVARRPNPPGLRAQALAALNKIEDKMLGPTVEEKLIRRALNQLPE